MLRIALAQVNPTVGDIDGNVDAVLRAWRRAAEAGADLVAFPELVVTGYPPEDLLFKPEFVVASEHAIERLGAEGPRDTLAVVGFVRRDPVEHDASEWDVTVAALEDLRNSAAVLGEGRVLGHYDKSRLPNYGVFDEGRYFTSDDEPLVVKAGGVRVGVTICEDLWTPRGPVAESVAAGAEVVVNINASPYQRGKLADRERWVHHHARAEAVPLAYVNAVGGQDELVFDGGSFVVDATGEVLARAQRFEVDLLLVDLDLGSIHRDGPPLEARTAPPDLDETAEVWSALVLGTRDYCHKNGFEDVVIGLSGGIDSSVTAAVAADAVGPDHVLGVSMPSPHSSAHSEEDAEELARALGVRYERIPIERGMRAYDDMLAGVFAGTEKGLAEENIQARIRGNLLMAISNKFGHLVLTTGNKSEMAVGYATLYGDMAGGFAVLKDCDKQLVYRLARHRNARSDGPVIPEHVLTKAPSAELRPGQRDSDSLPPYEVLDPILLAYIEEDLSVAEIVSRGFDERIVREVVQRVDRAEYKRRQAPPGVKISARAFGKDRRVPITNGWRG